MFPMFMLKKIIIKKHNNCHCVIIFLANYENKWIKFVTEKNTCTEYPEHTKNRTGFYFQEKFA